MLYGHVETYEERIDHRSGCARSRTRPAASSFIPLAFHPENTVFERRGWRQSAGTDDLKVIAVSRLLLDNISHVKAYWIMMGMPLAAVALHFGANDVQGTVVRETIFHAAGATTETEQKIEELVRYVREAGRVPVQRDTLYNELHGGRTDADAAHSGTDARLRGYAGRVVGGRGRPDYPRASRRELARVIRLGRISYVNMAPLFFRLTRRSRRCRVSRPRSTGRFSPGRSTLAPISSIEYARHAPRLKILPRLCVSSEGAVDSIRQLAPRAPAASISSVAVTPESRHVRRPRAPSSCSPRPSTCRLRRARRRDAPDRRRAPVDVRGSDAALRPGHPAEQTGLPMVYAVFACSTLAPPGVARADDALVAHEEARGTPRSWRARRARRTATPRAFSRATSRSSTTGSGRASGPACWMLFELARDAGELERVPELRFVATEAVSA